MNSSYNKNSNSYEKRVWQLTLGGLAIFIVGVFIGYGLDTGVIHSIQGYLFNAAGEATASNATNSNATNCNATNSNVATNPNATNSNVATNSNSPSLNATSGNVVLTDNILYLQTFSLGSASAQAGDRVNVIVGTSGADNTAISVVFKNTSSGSTFTTAVSSIGNNPYIIIPSNVIATDYVVTDVLLVGRNSDNTTFTRQYSLSPSVNSSYFNFNSTLTINAPQNTVEKPVPTSVSLESISIDKLSVTLNEKVYVTVKSSEELSILKLVFTSQAGEQMSVYAQSLTNNPYFEVPATTKVGNYVLTSATLVTNTSTVIYSVDGSVKDSKQFNFTSTIEIVAPVEETTEFVYNNEDITSEIIANLHSNEKDIVITVNADSNPIINEELFNAIKGKNKTLILNYNGNQFVFNGNDISSAKSIDVSLTASKLDGESEIGKAIENGVMVDFVLSGSLPGESLVRIKATDEIINVVGQKMVHVYRYNESSSKFAVVKLGIDKTSDGYYEFNITDSGDYVLVNAELEEDLIDNKEVEEEIVHFQKSDKLYLLLIVIAIVVIIVVTIVIIILKRSKKNQTKEVTIDTLNNNNNNL